MDKARTDARSPASGWAPLLVAGAAGALLMYTLDPQQGRRRIALVRDRIDRGARSSRAFTSAAWRDLASRAKGWSARAGAVFRRSAPSDDVLVARVRATLGRWVAHPHAVEVAAHDGRVVLGGPILEHERAPLLEHVAAVPGVRAVQSRLQVHAGAAHVPALQGGNGARTGPRSEYMQANWAPGPRLLALAAGTALVAWGLGRRHASGALLGLAGATLAARASANRPLGQWLGRGESAERGVQRRKPTAAETAQAPHETAAPTLGQRVGAAPDRMDGAGQRPH